MKIAKPKPIPYPTPCGFDKPSAAAAACSAPVSLKYTNDSVNHLSRTSVTSGVVVLRVSLKFFYNQLDRRKGCNLENLPAISFKIPAVQISKKNVLMRALKSDWSYFGFLKLPGPVSLLPLT